MNKVYDFENKDSSQKTLKFVKKLKPIRRRSGNRSSKNRSIRNSELKITGKIVSVIGPNEFVIKTKLGKYYPVVTDKTLSVIFDYYDTTLVIVNDESQKEYSLDIKYDVTVLLGEVTDFIIEDKTYISSGYKLVTFWGLER